MVDALALPSEALELVLRETTVAETGMDHRFQYPEPRDLSRNFPDQQSSALAPEHLDGIRYTESTFPAVAPSTPQGLAGMRHLQLNATLFRSRVPRKPLSR